MDKFSREIIDDFHRRMIKEWKRKLEYPLIDEEEREFYEYMIQKTEEDLMYDYTAVKLPYHTQIVRHLRTEPRKLVSEEEDMFFLHRWWRKFCAWLDWYWNK